MDIMFNLISILDNEAVSPEIQMVKVGEPMTIFCNSEVLVSWMFNEKELPGEVEYVKMNTIRIEQVDIEHRGLYECVGKKFSLKYMAQSHLKVASKYIKISIGLV